MNRKKSCYLMMNLGNGDRRGVVEQIVVEGQTGDHNCYVGCQEMVCCMRECQKKAIEVRWNHRKSHSAYNVVNQMSQ